MANPAPTINQINAFNATQGTIIDFNIIGGTELVRSNRIYIYDLSDNSLICTHLYVSTESIHELPANTDSSIVYESGKSSADFVNGAQYYAQIQTYTDTAGTEGGSGLSVAKMFWCLVSPTLTITTIPSTISTTSYNVSATYNANTSVVSNIIQQYQFNLYSATGSLLQSSGVVVGSGAQQGTSTAYDISYNFSGLSVGSSYYVVVDVTTTQGMNVSTQSNTFTVSIDTPTLGEATVVNNACDGYISVTSNLSGEYGGSASGEIASFVTSSVNDVSSLKVTLTPQQDGTPWIGTDHDNTPYLHRAMPTQSNDYNRESGVIIGGTVGWNQLMSVNSAIATYTKLGITLTRASDEPKWTINGTYEPVAGDKNFYVYSGMPISFIKNHVYVLATTSKYLKIYTYGVLSNARNFSVVVKASDNGTGSWCFNPNDVPAGTTINETASVNVFDLTAMFGTTIADYIYSLEQATAGAGVAWFRKLFPKPYYEYNAGELLSVSGLTSHDMVGFNQWDEEWEVGVYSSTNGTKSNATGRIRCKNLIPVISGASYYFKSSSALSIYGYDEDGAYVKQLATVMNQTQTIPSNVYNITFNTAPNSGTTYNNDICINLSDASLNGTYKPYTKHSYPLDSSLTLRGIPKLDASNNLYYDGDTYASDGTVTRKYGIVDLGTLNWQYIGGLFLTNIRTGGQGLDKLFANMVCPMYTLVDNNDYANWADKSMRNTNLQENPILRIKNDAYTDAATFKAAMSGVMLVYELATPTTESATPYTNPQVVDSDGTEEYVTANYVPVGHDSTYSLVCPISGWDEVETHKTGKNLVDVADENGSFNSYYKEFSTQYKLVAGKTYTLSATVNSSETPFYFNIGVGTENGGYINDVSTNGGKTNGRVSVTFTPTERQLSGHEYLKFRLPAYATRAERTYSVSDIQLELGSTATDYEPYDGQTITTPLPTTVYGGTVDVVNGTLTVDRAMVDLGTLNWTKFNASSGTTGTQYIYGSTSLTGHTSGIPVCSSYKGESQASSNANAWVKGNGTCSFLSSSDKRLYVRDDSLIDKTPAEFKAAMSGVQLCYELANPITYSLSPQEIQTLLGRNNVWSDGSVEVTYNIPITNLLVKRQDVADISGTWLTLYSQPITQASDMDFTFIDFLNQYGKTYKYALVPLLTQTQSGVEVEVEGGYTVSDEVQSVFDGVFIADQTGSQKCKANVGYGDVDMNQAVGTITPIGAKYPVVITNSKNQYHNGSISGTIVPDDYYFNGNLSRIDMVNKRNELEQFLTNKRAKIIKDWNSNIWLVMIMENINCSFNNEYGMGLVNFNANWIEVGDPTNQQDLQAAGLIDVGGV